MMRLKELREEKGITQKELGEILRISPSAIGMYETSRREPDYGTLKRIAHFFDVSIDYLLGNEEITPKKGYYLDNETAEIANALKEGDGMLRVMFDTVRKLPPEKMREAANYIEYLKAKQHPEED